MPDYEYKTPSGGVPSSRSEEKTPSDGIPEIDFREIEDEGVPSSEFDNVDTALVATNPDHRGPDDSILFGPSAAAQEIKDVDTDKIEAFPETARMVANSEVSAKWEVIGMCHDAMTEAGIPLTKASEIMASVVAMSGLVDLGPESRGPNGTLRPHLPGDAPHRRTLLGHEGAARHDAPRVNKK